MASDDKNPGGKMRILHITESSGGVQTFLSSFLRFRDRTRFSHAIMAPPDSAVYRGASGIFDAVYPLPMKREISPLKDFGAIFRLAGFLKENRFDIIHVHSSKAGFIGRAGARFGGHRRVVFQPHGFSFLLFEGRMAKLATAWERFAGRRLTSLLVATSPSEADRARNAGIPASKVVVIPNGVDCDRLQVIANRKSETDDTGFVLMIARLMRSKNPMMFARVANIVTKRKPSSKFVLIGAGFHDEFQDEMNDYIRKNSLGKGLTVLPWMEYEKMLDYVKRCAVYVSTSVSESFGYAVVESMFLGKPVVGTLIDGTRDIVVPDETGLLVEPNDDEVMAERVLHLLESRMLREVYGAIGRKRAVELYDAGKNITLLENLYQGLMSSRP